MRAGDFYQFFGPDALAVARKIGLTIQGTRDRPMCGVPAHRAKEWFGLLAEQGICVFILEED